jgi:hypothetical protein
VRLAAALGITDYTAENYEDYTEVAEKLFAHMVLVLKRNWPKKYPSTWGYLYNVSADANAELTYLGKIIDRQMAEQMGMAAVETEAELRQQLAESQQQLADSRQREALLLQQLSELLPSAQSAVSVEDDIQSSESDPVQSTTASDSSGRDGRSHGIVIGRDLITGAEVEYANAEQAANACGISPAALRRTFVDHRAQLQGKHWRTKGMPFWVPPDGFVFDPEHYERSHGKPVRATSESEVRIFESRIAAAKILRYNRPRMLGDYVGTRRPFLGYVWTDVTISEYGTWSLPEDDPNTSTSTSTSIPTRVILDDSGINGRCNGKVIARDLTTGVEVIYDSATRAAAFNNICKHSLESNFIDKPRHVRGKHFRSFTATRYWSPPAYFKFDASSFEKKSNGPVVATDEMGEITVLYESVKVAAQLEGAKRWSVQQYLNSGKPCRGRIWRSATAEEYDTWRDVAPI